MNGYCRLLEWDSEFFGFRIARIEANRIKSAQLPEILEWCKSERVDCIYFLADIGCSETVEAAESVGFALKDIRISYELCNPKRPPLPNVNALGYVRRFKSEDMLVLERIAGEIHADTRFFFDTRFPRKLASRLYQVWLAKSCSDPKGTVLVLEWEGAVAGYVSCEVDVQGNGQIGLLGVDAPARGYGFGRMLLDAALGWFADRDVQKLTVVTQGRNIAAQRLYQRAGFLIQSTAAWHHKWFTHP